MVELMERLEKTGFSERELQKLILSNCLAEEIFKIVHDEMIREYYLGNIVYLQETQIEKYRKWNCSIKLGIKEQEFESIPTISGKQLLVPNKNQLLVLVLFYETGNPIKTFLNGVKILQEEFRGIKIEVFTEEILTQKNNNESLLSPGFHWLLLELGREALLSSQPEIYTDTDTEKINTIKKRRKKEGKREIGCELLNIAAAFYLEWVRSIGYRQYPVPVCLGSKQHVVFDPTQNSNSIKIYNIKDQMQHLNLNMLGIVSLVKEIK